MRWVFQLYDADQSGAVSMSEMVILFAGIYQIEGIENGVAVDRAESVFGNLDINGDGDITEEEFVQGCLKVVIKKLNEICSRVYVFRIRIWSECYKIPNVMKLTSVGCLPQDNYPALHLHVLHRKKE